MRPGYTMSLSYVRQMPPPFPWVSASEKVGSTEMVRFSGGFPLSRRRIRFEDEKSESSSEVSTSTVSCMNPGKDASCDISFTLRENSPPNHEPRIRNLILSSSQHSLPWITRAKSCLRLSYLVLQWLARYLLLGYLFVFLAGIGSEPSMDGRGSLRLFDPNNIMTDLLPAPITSLQRYFGPLQQFVVHNTTAIERSIHHTEDIATDKWAYSTEKVAPTSIGHPQPTPSSTDVSYIDLIDRALGWKGFRAQQDY